MKTKIFKDVENWIGEKNLNPKQLQQWAPSNRAN